MSNFMNTPMNKCTLPPDGWTCTREAGHDGPCAAIQADSARTPDAVITALRAQNKALRAERDTLLHELENVWKPAAAINEQYARSYEQEWNAAKAELAYVTLQRDALLDITWLDLPAEPDESTARWRELFNAGWERRALLDDAQADTARLNWLEAHGHEVSVSCWKGEGAESNPWTIHEEFPDKLIAEEDTLRETIDAARARKPDATK